MFIDAMGIGLIMPIIPDLIQEVSSVNISTAAIYGGYLAFVYALMQFLCSPTLGNLSDHYGRRPVLLVSLGALSIDYVIMGFAPSFTLLVLGRFVAGVAGATHATVFAYIADVSTQDRRARRFGLINAAFGLGFIAGPVLGGLIGELDTRAPFFFAAGCAALNCLYGWFAMPESLSKEKRRPFSLKRSNPIGALVQVLAIPGLVYLLSAFFLFNLAGWVYPTIWPYYLREAFDWGSREVGISLGIYGISNTLTLIFVVQLLLRVFRETTISVIGIVFQAATLVTLLFVEQGWILFLFMPICALEGVAIPVMQSLMSSRVPDDAQGELQGAIASTLALSTIVSPLIMSQAFAFFIEPGTPFYHPAGAFGVAALVSLLALIPLWWAISSTSRLQEPAQ
ncbi:TCR/Tet family MFS transporter [Cohaesibacter sp. ES.047]|uniref:TCR/Tet family MFS transporter n=1 Tax=Cohaesibacter sp. ES.047 TaxID=1798205 RepID=UPI000BB7799E|nr:TCR/Tet family MFS transporter [Cohaesibacter sp. ES.047]